MSLRLGASALLSAAAVAWGIGGLVSLTAPGSRMARAEPPQAQGLPDSLIVEVAGKVSDFDERYVYLSAPTEKYRILRRQVPADVELRPGGAVDFDVPLDAVRIIKLKAIKPIVPSHPPRKREVSDL